MPLPLAEQLDLLTEVALEDLGTVWQFGGDDIIAALHEVMPPLIDTWASAAATLAANWYDMARDEQNIDGAFTAVIPEMGDLGANELVGWATEPLLQPEPDLELTRSRLEGGTQRRIANAARETIMTSSVEDPKARGWKRVVRPGACGFCRMLAARGYAYKTKDSSTFGSHDHCSCSAEPGWSTGKAVKVRKFEPSTKDTTAAERQAVYKWIKEHQPIA
jgi:hypothetical protein